MSERVPKTGDVVWFYFRHACSEVVESDGFAIDLFTGATKMQCRPPVVQAVRVIDPRRVSDLITEAGVFDLELKVKFNPEDRILVPGGVVFAPPALQRASAHWGGRDHKLGKVDRAWPEHLTWAWDPIPGFDGGGR